MVKIKRMAAMTIVPIAAKTEHPHKKKVMKHVEDRNEF